MTVKTLITALLLSLCVMNSAIGQSLAGRVYFGEDIMNQGKGKSSVDASVRLEFVNGTEARLTPSIKAKPDANFMMKFGLKMAQKKMAKAVAEKPLARSQTSGGCIAGAAQRFVKLSAHALRKRLSGS